MPLFTITGMAALSALPMNPALVAAALNQAGWGLIGNLQQQQGTTGGPQQGGTTGTTTYQFFFSIIKKLTLHFY